MYTHSGSFCGRCWHSKMHSTSTREKSTTKKSSWKGRGPRCQGAGHLRYGISWNAAGISDLWRDPISRLFVSWFDLACLMKPTQVKGQMTCYWDRWGQPKAEISRILITGMIQCTKVIRLATYRVTFPRLTRSRYPFGSKLMWIRTSTLTARKQTLNQLQNSMVTICVGRLKKVNESGSKRGGARMIAVYFDDK